VVGICTSSLLDVVVAHRLPRQADHRM